LSDRSGYDWQRLLAAGVLIFSLALCVVVAQAGWKEIVAEECSLSGPPDCQVMASSPGDASQ
jgi:hypothetical protein